MTGVEGTGGHVVDVRIPMCNVACVVLLERVVGIPSRNMASLFNIESHTAVSSITQHLLHLMKHTSHCCGYLMRKNSQHRTH